MRKAAPSLLMTFAIAMVASSDAYAEIAWQTNLRTAHAQAQSEGKLLLLHFYSDNCSWCEKLEKGAFQEPLVGQAISESFVPVKVHANASPKLAEMFKVTKFPTDVIVTTDGKTLAHTVSPQSPDRYVSMLKSSRSGIAGGPSAPTVTEVATAPALPETQPAIAQAQTPAAAENLATDSYPVPGYAASAAPRPTATASIESPQANSVAAGQVGPGFALPSSAFGGTEAQLAGSRGGLSLEMPALDPPATPASNAPAAGAADLLAKSTTVSSVTDSSVTDSPSAPTSEPTSVGSTTRPISQKQPELAMQGFCPVTVIRDDKWVEGKPEFGVIHLGKLYLFTSEENMQTFLNDPVPYTPVLNEIDAVVFFEERRIVPGKREWGLKDPIYNRMFFFADEASMNHFYNQYERYTKAAIEVMDKAVKDANPGT